MKIKSLIKKGLEILQEFREIIEIFQSEIFHRSSLVATSKVEQTPSPCSTFSGDIPRRKLQLFFPGLLHSSILYCLHNWPHVHITK